MKKINYTRTTAMIVGILLVATTVSSSSIVLEDREKPLDVEKPFLTTFDQDDDGDKEDTDIDEISVEPTEETDDDTRGGDGEQSPVDFEVSEEEQPEIIESEEEVSENEELYGEENEFSESESEEPKDLETGEEQSDDDLGEREDEESDVVLPEGDSPQANLEDNNEEHSTCNSETNEDDQPEDIEEPDPLLGDLDYDGDVDQIDLDILLDHYGMTGDVTYEMGDIDEDGDVDLSDLAALLANYTGSEPPINHPPYVPSNPNPEDTAQEVNINIDLSWTGGDPDPEDIVTYDVYFGTTNTNPLSKVVNNQTSTTYNPGELAYHTTYYWKIIAWDNHNASAEGPIWTFTTEDYSPPEDGPSIGDNHPNRYPIADASAGEPYHGFVEEEITFDGSLSYDPDGTIVSYLWDFGDGTSETGRIITHGYSSVGTYAVVLTVIDNDAAYSSDETTAVIVIPNTPPTILEIDGPTVGKANIKHTYTAVSTDADNDAIKYIFDWGDGEKDESEFLDSDTPFSTSHEWSELGIYTITVTVMDNQTVTSSTTTMHINAAIFAGSAHIKLGTGAFIGLIISALILFMLLAIFVKRKKWEIIH